MSFVPADARLECKLGDAAHGDASVFADLLGLPALLIVS